MNASTNYTTQFLAIVILVFTIQSLPAQVFVDLNATGTNDGSSWQNAHTTIQPAIDNPRSETEEIWVAAGTYFETINMADNRKLIGGFLAGMTDVSERNFEANVVTIDASTAIVRRSVIACFGTRNFIIDGFTITGGISEFGGGIDLQKPDFGDILNCIIINNSASFGGGISIEPLGKVCIENVSFINNTAALHGGGAKLGANNQNSLFLTNCRFINNQAELGGAINQFRYAPEIDKCVFIKNTADLGGAIFSLGLATGIPKITNSTFYENHANSFGGVLYRGGYGTGFINCSFYVNTSGENGSVAYFKTSGGVFGNCIIGYNGNSSNPSCIFVDSNPLSGAGRTYLTNTTIIGSSSRTVLYGGLSDEFWVKNCIIANNFGSALTKDIEASPSKIEYSLFFNNWSGEIRLDDSGGTPIRLLYGSYALNNSVNDENAFNYFGDPLLVMDTPAAQTGIWSEMPVYDSISNTTILTDANSNYIPGELEERVIFINNNFFSPSIILRNTENQIVVFGDGTSLTTQGVEYRLLDFHLAPGSAAIGRGVATTDLDFENDPIPGIDGLADIGLDESDGLTSPVPLLIVFEELNTFSNGTPSPIKIADLSNFTQPDLLEIIPSNNVTGLEVLLSKVGTEIHATATGAANLATGSYYIQLQLTGPDDISDSDYLVVNVEEPPKPEITILNDFIINENPSQQELEIATVINPVGGSLEISFENVPTGLSVSGEISSGTISISAESTSELNPGIYSVRLIVENDIGGISEEPISVYVGPHSDFYFAEGNTKDLETYIHAVNPLLDDVVELDMTFYFEDREPLVYSDGVGARARRTFFINDILNETTFNLHETIFNPQPFSVKMTSRNNLPFFAERAIYKETVFNRRLAGNSSVGSRELSSEWNFAEGTTTSGRETQLSILNPNDTESELEITFFIEGFSPLVIGESISAKRRLTVRASDYMVSNNFSTKVSSINRVPIYAERTMNFGDGNFSWSHNVHGQKALSSKWFFAEGATHSYFETFLLLGNSNDEDVNANIRFLLKDGEPIERKVFLPGLVTLASDSVTINPELPSSSRVTINVEKDFPEMANQANFATEITTPDDLPIIAERAMYWKTINGRDRNGAHAVMGITEAKTRWFFPEGAAWGSSRFECFILLCNSTERVAEVRVSLLRESGEPIIIERTLPAGRRETIKANDFLPDDQGTQSFSTIAESINGVPIAAERVMYFGSRVGGHASTGISLD